MYGYACKYWETRSTTSFCLWLWEHQRKYYYTITVKTDELNYLEYEA